MTQYLGAARERGSDYDASLVYMSSDDDYDSNVDTDKILLLLARWYAEDYMEIPLIIRII